MTAYEYMQQKFASLGLILNDADFYDIVGDIEKGESIDEIKDELHEDFIKFIPSILIRPTAISEGGVSISRAQRSDIEAYYNYECGRLGIENALVKKPRVRFL